MSKRWLSDDTVAIDLKSLAAGRAGEVCEILFGQGKPLRGRARSLDVSEGEAEAVEFVDENR